MSGLKAPGTPWQQGRGPQSVTSQPKAQMVQGISPRLAQSAAMAGGDMAEAVNDLGKQVEAMARKMFEEDMVADLQEKESGLQEWIDTLLKDPDSGVLTLKGGDARGVTGKVDDQIKERIEAMVGGLSGNYREIALMKLHGVRQDMKRVVAQHELVEKQKWREAMGEASHMAALSRVREKATSENIGQIAKSIEASVNGSIINAVGGPEQKKLMKMKRTQELWGQFAESRITNKPEESLALIASIKEGDDPFLKAENFSPAMLGELEATARDAYVSTMGQRYKDQVEQFGLVAATEAIQKDPWFTEAEKGGLIREARQVERALISDADTARRIANQQRDDRLTTLIFSGKSVGDKDLYDMGYRGGDLAHAKATRDAILRQPPKQTDIPTLLMLVDLAENGWTDPEIGKHRAFETYDLARPEFTKALGAISKEDLFGKVIPLSRKSKELSSSDQRTRSDAKKVFNARTKSFYGKDDDKLWQAEDQWNANYETLRDKLGRTPTTEELSEMGNKMMGEIVVSSGVFGNTTSKRWEARYAVRTEGANMVPEAVREAIIKQYLDAGMPEPDNEAIFQRYTDPRNQAWVQSLLSRNNRSRKVGRATYIGYEGLGTYLRDSINK